MLASLINAFYPFQTLVGVEKPTPVKGKRGRPAGSKNKKPTNRALAAAAALVPGAALAAAAGEAAAHAALAAAAGTSTASDAAATAAPATKYTVSYEDGSSAVLTVSEVELEPAWLVWNHAGLGVSTYAMQY